MYVETFIGPFDSNGITVTGNILHIGIEQPQSTPITFSIYKKEWKNLSKYPDVSFIEQDYDGASFNEMSKFFIEPDEEDNIYYLNAGDMLEFGDMNTEIYSEITIKPQKPNNEYTIITVGYESKGE